MSSFVDTFLKRFSTALIADAAFRSRVPITIPRSGLVPLSPGWKIAGPVRTVDAENDLAAVLLGLERAEEGEVLVIANQKPGQAGLMGDIIATEARRKKLAGIVVDCLVRDVADVRQIGLPVWSRGAIPVGPLKLSPDQRGIGKTGTPVLLGGMPVKPGDMLFADDDGVVVIDPRDCEAVEAESGRSLEKEKELLSKLKKGASLGELFDIEAFYERRKTDPDLTLNEHLASKNSAI